MHLPIQVWLERRTQYDTALRHMQTLADPAALFDGLDALHRIIAAWAATASGR